MRRLLSLHAVVALFATLLATVLLAPPAHAAGVATVTGTVSASEGGRLSSVAVTLLRWNAAAEDWDEAGTVTTGRDGTYALDVPEAGSYVVEYFDDAAEGPYRRTAWGQGVYEFPWEPGDPGTFTVRAGTSVPARNVSLPLAPEVSGRVMAGNASVPYPAIKLYYYDDYDRRWYFLEEFEGDRWGHYNFQVDLPPGVRYTASFSQRGYSSRYIGGTAGLPGSPTSTNSRPVKVSGSTTIPTPGLYALPGAQGRVWAWQELVVGAEITAHAYDTARKSWTPVDSTTTDAKGEYTVYATPGTKLSVSITAEGYPTPRWMSGTATGPVHLNSWNHVVVPASGRVSFPDISITGTATPSNITLPTVHGLRAVGQTLTAKNGTWDTPNLSYGYQWLRNGADIIGARGKTYTLQPADANQDITVRVYAYWGTSYSGRANAAVSRIAKLTSSTTASLHATTVTTAQHARVRVNVQVQSKQGPTGRVQIFHGNRLLTSTPLNGSERGAIPRIDLPKLGAGTYTLRAVYTPASGNINSSTSSWFQVRVTR